MWNGTMFVDLDWPLNASSLLSASAELLVSLFWCAVDDKCHMLDIYIIGRFQINNFVCFQHYQWKLVLLAEHLIFKTIVLKGKGSRFVYSASTWSVSKGLRYSTHCQGITPFYLHTLRFIRKRNELYLPLPSQPQMVLIYRPGGMEGWVDLSAK